MECCPVVMKFMFISVTWYRWVPDAMCIKCDGRSVLLLMVKVELVRLPLLLLGLLSKVCSIEPKLWVNGCFRPFCAYHKVRVPRHPLHLFIDLRVVCACCLLVEDLLLLLRESYGCDC